MFFGASEFADLSASARKEVGQMTTGVFKVTWGGRGNIVWERLADSPEQLNLMSNALTISSQVGAIASVFTAGLSLVTVAQNARIMAQLSAMQKDVSSLKARFDLLFLDRSLDYFEDSHRNRIGIDVNIAEALRQDCLNALSQMVGDKSLSVPAFLRHRCLAYSSAMNQFNHLIYAVLHDGVVNYLDSNSLKSWAKNVPSLKGVSPDGGFVSQNELLQCWHEELAVRDATKKSSSIVDRLSSKEAPALTDEACSVAHFDRCAEVVLLLREIEVYIRYAHLLSSKKPLNAAREVILKLAK